MPPKVVYGKRTAVRPTSTFSKFLTPEREDGAGPAITKSKGKQKKNGAKEEGEEEVERSDPFEEIEKSFAGLKVADEEKEVEVVAEKQKRRGRRKVLKDTDANVESKFGVNPDKDFKEPISCVEEKADTVSHRTPEGTRKPKPNAKGKKASTSRHKPEKIQSDTPQATPEPEDVFSAHVEPLLSITYDKKIIAFEDWAASLEPHFEITKIAEASFSEVYRLKAVPSMTGITQESVLKIVALRTPPDAPLPCQSHERAARDPERQAKKERAEREENDSWKSHVDDVHSEVKLLQNLNDIPGFTNFRELTVLQGRPSTAFVNAWKTWNKSRARGRKSDFPDPSKKTSYEATQLWAVIEMQDAGTDCEKIMEAGGLSSIWEVWDVFWGVCLSVAKAEEVCKFEHRDMHLENICIRSSQPESNVIEPIIKDPIRKKLGFSGLETTVIDYTLSRADVVSSLSQSTAEPDVAYLDLNKDPGVFEGDATEEYQYEIYRYMRGAALYNNPLQTSLPEPPPPEPTTPRRSPRKNAHIRFPDDTPPPNTHIRFSETDTPRRSPRKAIAPAPVEPHVITPPEDIWRTFHPKTNLLWLHYILHRLLTHLTPNNPTILSASQITRNVHPDYVNEDPARVKKKAVKLFKILEIVARLLRPEGLAEDGCLGSVKELVVRAMEERWVRVGDVAG